MVDDNEHVEFVNAWMKRAVDGVPPAQLVQAFQRGFDALWARAHQTLGVVTLTAIADRVLYVAAEKHPVLSSLKLDSTGLQCHNLSERAATVGQGPLEEAVRFVMIEFLTVLGNLTSEILTPALHAKLSTVAPEKLEADAQASAREYPNPEGDGEGTMS